MNQPVQVPSGWSLAGASLRQPYRVTAPMVVLALLVPGYIFLAELLPGRVLHRPELPLDRLVPLRPAWALVYGCLYLFLILLPIVVVRQQEGIRRTVYAYLLVWSVAFACFLAYPTIAPRPAAVAGGGFRVWGLRFLYEADPPYNCFPSIHVAHSFVSALACRRVHRLLGRAALGCASLVAVSTLYAKQHYVLDVAAGIALASAASRIFLTGDRFDATRSLESRAAPALALGVVAVVGAGLACFYTAYLFSGGRR